MARAYSSLARMFTVAFALGVVACAHNPSPSQPARASAQPFSGDPYGSIAMPSTAPELDGPGRAETAATGNEASPSTQLGSTMAQAGSPIQARATTASDGDASLLDDSQIAAVLVALNEGEIAEGRLAQASGRSPQVKAFANHMVAGHRRMLARASAVIARAAVTPRDSAVSQQLQVDVRNHMSTMQAMRGEDFDREYVGAQVLAHTQALDLIDRLLPRVQDAPLKTELLDARGNTYEQLREAASVQRKLRSP